MLTNLEAPLVQLLLRINERTSVYSLLSPGLCLYAGPAVNEVLIYYENFKGERIFLRINDTESMTVTKLKPICRSGLGQVHLGRKPLR